MQGELVKFPQNKSLCSLLVDVDVNWFVANIVSSLMSRVSVCLTVV